MALEAATLPVCECLWGGGWGVTRRLTFPGVERPHTPGSWTQEGL